MSQYKTMYPGINNSPMAYTTAKLDAEATEITLDDASRLPAAPNIATIGVDDDAELVLYTGKGGNTLTGCTRGWNDTTAKTWKTGAPVYRAYTAYDQAALIANIKTLINELAGKQPAGDYLTKETDPNVPAWAKAPNKPTYTATDVGAAEAEHDHAIADVTGLQAALNGKQAAGNYLTAETDPNVPAWAKEKTKPSYTYTEVGAAAASHSHAVADVSGLQSALDGKQAKGSYLPTTGGTMTGNLTMSGAAPQILFASGARTNTPIAFYKGDANGSGIVIGDGGRTIIGGGEAAQSLRTALGTDAAKETSEELHLANDGTVNIHTNCQTITDRKTFIFGNDGRITHPGNFKVPIVIPITTAAVATTAWNASSKTASAAVTGLLVTDHIIVTAHPNSHAVWGKAGIRCTAQAAGSITLTCDTVPTGAVIANVLIIRL